MEKGIHECNGSNNKKKGHGKDEWAKYTSSTRTLFRMMWMTKFIEEMFNHLLHNPEMSGKQCAGAAYDIALGVHHNFLLRGVIKTGLLLTPSKEVFLSEIFGGAEKAKEFTEDERFERLSASHKKMIEMMENWWKFYEDEGLLGIK